MSCVVETAVLTVARPETHLSPQFRRRNDLRHGLLPCAAIALTLFAACTEEEEEKLPELPLIYGVHDMTADFSSYRTFDVVEPGDVPADETEPKAYLESNRIAVIQSIVAEMEQRGYTRDQTDPDLLISPFVRLQETEVLIEEAWYDYYYGYYWGYGYPWYDQDVVTLEAGTLIIDAVDVGERENAADDKLVFRGYAAAILPTQPVDVSHEIAEAVSEIFDFWPSK
jgi:hypothetical protein